MSILLGSHISISGGIHKAIEKGNEIGCNVIQIFTKNSNRWNSKSIDEGTITTYKNYLDKSKIKSVIVHDSYLINLAAQDPMILTKSREMFIDEIRRCEQLGITYLNFHPGSHINQGEEKGIIVIAESLNYIHQQTKDCKVVTMLETTAGQGSSLGYKFNQIKDIIELVENKNRLAVCIDTCHIFAAGYDISNEKSYKKVIKEFDNVIGIDYLKAFHLNDSKKELGSRVDRHANIGKGMIGIKAFELIMNDKRFNHIPKILETPKSPDYHEDIEAMNLLRSLIKNNN